MKKILLLSVLLLFMLTVSAESMKTVKLHFDKQQFSFVENAVGAIRIVPNGILGIFGSDTTQPGLPLVSVSVGVPDGVTLKNVRESFGKNLVCTNVVVASNPQSVHANYEGKLPPLKLPTYNQSVYPNKKIQYIGSSKMGNYNILRFLVCPFEYDVQGKRLYLVDDMTLSLTLNDAPVTLSAIASENQKNNMLDVFKSQIVNANEFVDSGIATLGLDLGGSIRPINTGVEYLIVTSQALVSSFKPLALWKKAKGVNSKIVTVEEISNIYPDLDIQLAIKTYLKKQYQENGLQYVLLGGDDSVVPIMGCYGEAGGQPDDQWYILDKNMPTDLYYACFDGCFSWDSNGNGMYGDYSDTIDMTPSIYVTRVPIRSAEEAGAFVEKILGYEQTPVANGWNNNLLMAGSKLYVWMPSIIPGLAAPDSQSLGDTLYAKSIKPYWDGEITRLYDTQNIAFAKDHLQEYLSKGYTFVDVTVHGLADRWQFDRVGYGTNSAMSLQNPNYTIITSISCYTNSFESYDDGSKQKENVCLSEGFIRNPNSGVVAYLGNSRVGWVDDDSTVLGPSAVYEKQYYEYLFSDKFKNKNYGKLVAAAKSSLISASEQDCIYRWIQFELNPVGDPEMPIYTTTPKTFSAANVSFGLDGNSVTVNAGVDSCRICIMSTDDEGLSNYRVLNNVRSATFHYDKASSICITKQNYIPYYYAWAASTKSTSKITNCSMDKSASTVDVSVQLDAGVKDAKISISSAMGNLRQTYSISADDPQVKADVSKFNNGVLTVSMFADGKLADSRSFIK